MSQRLQVHESPRTELGQELFDRGAEMVVQAEGLSSLGLNLTDLWLAVDGGIALVVGLEQQGASETEIKSAVRDFVLEQGQFCGVGRAWVLGQLGLMPNAPSLDAVKATRRL